MTLYEQYIQKTTIQGRNSSPRECGMVETLSDIIEHPASRKNLPQALKGLHEFHRSLIDRSKVSSNDELERVATMMTLCFAMMVSEKRKESI